MSGVWGFIVKPPKKDAHPVRDTAVMKALAYKVCQSCRSVDHIVVDGAPYIDKNNNVHIRAFCGDCGSITKWRWDGKNIEQK